MGSIGSSISQMKKYGNPPASPSSCDTNSRHPTHHPVADFDGLSPPACFNGSNDAHRPTTKNDNTNRGRSVPVQLCLRPENWLGHDRLQTSPFADRKRAGLVGPDQVHQREIVVFVKPEAREHEFLITAFWNGEKHPGLGVVFCNARLFVSRKRTL